MRDTKMNAAAIQSVEPRRLRRIALDAQGLLRNAPFGRGRSGAQKAIEHLGYVQIDTISVVERAHHHTLWARVPNYRQVHLEQLVRAGKVFEYWAHAAAYLPMRDYRFALPRMHDYASGQARWVRSRDKKLMSAVLRRIEQEGPLRARDFETPKGHKGGWWAWKPAKRALEQLFMEGRLMIAGREGFEKIYDVPERVLTDDIDTTMPSPDEQAAHLVDSTIRAFGFAQSKECVYHRRGHEIRKDVNRVLRARVDAGALVELRCKEGDGTYFASPEVLERSAPRTQSRVSLLCPFDNVLIQRDRGKRIHDFDYQLECYVEAHKRRYGYFCLPILYRDEFIGRMDCKADRKDRVFIVQALHFEEGLRDLEAVLEPLSETVSDYATFNGCDRIRVVRVEPRATLAQAKRALEDQ
jgi:uncharacterized protein YcaQ